LNRELRKLFVLKREEVLGSWRRLHNEKLHDFYAAPNFIRVKPRNIWTGHVAHNGRDEKFLKILRGKPETKRSLGRPGRRW